MNELASEKKQRGHILNINFWLVELYFFIRGKENHINSYFVMLIAAYVIDGMARLFKINQPVSPVRIRKLVRSNNIVPAYLKKHGYPYQYTFHQALEDWKRNQPGDWEAEEMDN